MQQHNAKQNPLPSGMGSIKITKHGRGADVDDLAAEVERLKDENAILRRLLEKKNGHKDAVGILEK